MLEVYRNFAEEWMAMPVLTGPKSDGQKFPGAVYTLCIEAMMQDSKALQAGTSHFLGQNFAKAFDVKFQNAGRPAGICLGDQLGRVDAADRRPDHDALATTRAWWCRRGWRRFMWSSCRSSASPKRRQAVLAAAQKLADADSPGCRCGDWFNYEPMIVKVDDRDQYQPGFKFNEWELKGVPVRVELGPKDLAKNACVLARRDLPGKEGKEMGVPLAARRATHRRAAAAKCRTILFEQGQEVPRRQHAARSIPTTSSRRRSRSRAASCGPTGTAPARRKTASPPRPRRRFAAFRSTARRRRASAW